jgi:hypothetical protein
VKRFLRYTFLVCLSSIPMGVAIGHVSSSGWDMVLLLIAWFWSTLVADFRERKF